MVKKDKHDRVREARRPLIPGIRKAGLFQGKSIKWD
jgi:hypothetical protein